ncbi:hypothetical protein J4Q44_G00338240 [Coregonus suidteri]|uniref:Thymus-specific serine protease n=1 Tax=Coregonus suidteri TaxID=861788 RepID=A0AAN8L0E8_9TELE
MAINPGSAWLPYTKKLRDLCLMVEHRFDGDSRPTADLSTENLRRVLPGHAGSLAPTQVPPPDSCCRGKQRASPRHNQLLRYHVEQCQDNFNISAKTLYSGIDQTKKNYSSYNIRATRIVFPNSSIDPWHALGITSSISDDLPAIFIKGTAHCANMYPARAEDHPQLTLAREHVFQLLQTWLKEK